MLNEILFIIQYPVCFGIKLNSICLWIHTLYGEFFLLPLTHGAKQLNQGVLYYRPPNGDWFRAIGSRFSHAKIGYLAHKFNKLGISIA